MSTKRKVGAGFLYQELPSGRRRRANAPKCTPHSQASRSEEGPCHCENGHTNERTRSPTNSGEHAVQHEQSPVNNNFDESYTVLPEELSPPSPIGFVHPSRDGNVSFYADSSPISQGLANDARVSREKGNSVLSSIMEGMADGETGLASDPDDEGAGPHACLSSSDEEREEGRAANTSLSSSSLLEKTSRMCSVNTIAVSVLGEVCPCGKDCTSHMCRREVLKAREATALAATNRKLQEHTRKVLTEIMHTSPITQKKTFRFTFNATTICIESFRLVHGFSVTGLRNAMTWCKADDARRMDIDLRNSTGSVPLVSDDKDFKGLGGTERALAAETWISEYVEHHGCKMPDTDHIHIDNVPWGEIHKEYMLDTKEFCKPLETSRFRGIWKEAFPNVKKRRRKPFGECGECAGFKGQLEVERRDPQQRKITMRKYLAHLAHQKMERMGYYRRRAKGKRGRCISVIMDGMDQSKTDLPHTCTSLKSDSNMVETKITGVLVHGRNFNCYVSEPQVKHDTNLSLTCLHDTLMDELANDPADTLYVQVDGGPENKNQWMIAYFVLLISLGIFKKIKMCFLPVGHTHEDIDQGFSCIARYLRRVNAYTFAQLVKHVQDSFKKEEKPPQVFQVGQVFDWKAYVASTEVQAMSSWTDNHIYRFSWNPHHKQVQMHYKKFDQSPAYFGYHSSTYVTSFKQVEKEAAKDPSAWDRHGGILLGTKEKPPGPPHIAENFDFNEPTLSKTGREG